MDPRGPKNQATECKHSCGRIQVPSEEEVKALRAMREIKGRVRELKKRISEISASNKTAEGGVLIGLKDELAELKVAWDEWEKKRKEAAKVRMILLGHEKEDESAQK